MPLQGPEVQKVPSAYRNPTSPLRSLVLPGTLPNPSESASSPSYTSSPTRANFAPPPAVPRRWLTTWLPSPSFEKLSV